MKRVATVLFSGGTDSTLAAARALDEHERVVLLSLDPGPFVFFLDNARVHAEALVNKYGPERVSHHVLCCRHPVRSILGANFRRDLRTYDFSMASLVCLGCRLGMHAQAIIYNLEHGIPYLVDGSVAKQATIPEQMQTTVEANRDLYWSHFGIVQRSPIYHERHSDKEVYKLGLTKDPRLKRQFILFDTQATCLFGVPADVHSRLFYGWLQPGLREQEVAAYRQQKYKRMLTYVSEKLHGRVPELVQRLRATVQSEVPSCAP